MTLVELLVVIAVVALLAALLFPLLSRVRGRSSDVVCRSNLRQLGGAFAMYLADWDGVYPSPGGLRGERNYWDQGSDAGIDAYLRQRHSTPSVWVCPVVDYWESQWERRSYSMNSMLRDPPDVTPYTKAILIADGISADAVPAPSNTILLYEGVQNVTDDPDTGRGYVARCGDWSMVRGYYAKPVEGLLLADRPYHGLTNNYLLCDGHVRAMSPDPREPNGPQAGRNWWYVAKLR
jgi:prepilin-type processing-associated H-X9-DG protein